MVRSPGRALLAVALFAARFGAPLLVLAAALAIGLLTGAEAVSPTSALVSR